VSDAAFKEVIVETFEANYAVYGARKMWKALQRAGHHIGRDRVARLMRGLGLQGARRGRRLRTTRPNPRGVRPTDLVDRQFDPTAPNRLWVLDITYVPTWAHVAYVCLIVDAFARRIVGWRVATNMRTDMVLDALEMAAWGRGTQLGGLVCHSDAGSQPRLKGPSQRCRQAERRSSVSAWPSSAPCRRSARSVTATTTPWPRR
jgi:putative transposase